MDETQAVLEKESCAQRPVTCVPAVCAAAQAGGVGAAAAAVAAHDGASVSWRPRRRVHVLEQGVEDVVLHDGWGDRERPGRESSALW